MFRFESPDPPVATRNAATVVVVRDSPSGVQIFCVQRHLASGFLGGAVVFPGGQVDAADADPRWSSQCTPVSSRCLLFGDAPDEARAFAIAALRETLEEAAIVPFAGADLDDASVRELRVELAAGPASFFDVLKRRRLVLDTRRLVPLSRWVTPLPEKRRYDTRFYVLPAPPAQTGLHDAHETTTSFWATAEELLRRWEASEILLAPPTSCTIELFVGLRTVDDALRVACAHPLHAVCPQFVQDGADLVLAMPGDPLYPEAGATASEAYPRRFVMIGTRFVAIRK